MQTEPKEKHARHVQESRCVRVYVCEMNGCEYELEYWMKYVELESDRFKERKLSNVKSFCIYNTIVFTVKNIDSIAYLSGTT